MRRPLDRRERGLGDDAGGSYLLRAATGPLRGVLLEPLLALLERRPDEFSWMRRQLGHLEITRHE